MSRMGLHVTPELRLDDEAEAKIRARYDRPITPATDFEHATVSLLLSEIAALRLERDVLRVFVAPVE